MNELILNEFLEQETSLEYQTKLKEFADLEKSFFKTINKNQKQEYENLQDLQNELFIIQLKSAIDFLSNDNKN